MNALWTPQYYQKVLALDPIAYWMLDEKSGTVAYDLVSGRVAGAQNGTHTGVTLGQPGIGDGRTAPLYDGLNDFTGIRTAAYAAAFNGSEGSVMAWGKVSGAGVWTDAQGREFWQTGVDGANFMYLRKGAAANRLEWLYMAGGVFEVLVENGVTDTDWMQLCMTWSATADRVDAYRNGGFVTTSGTLGVWAGVPATATIGADNGIANFFSGYLAQCAVWDRRLAADEVTASWIVE